MAVQQDEYKSTVGLKDVYIAAVTADGVEAYTAGTPQKLAPAISANRTATINAKTQFADDQSFEAMSSEGESKIDLEVTNLPLSIKALITGKKFDAAEGRLYDNAGAPSYYALGFRSLKSNGKYRYYWLLKGQFTISGEEKATKTDSPDPKSVKLTYTAIKTVHQFWVVDVMDGVKAVEGDEDISAFDETGWFAEVQTPPEGSGS